MQLDPTQTLEQRSLQRLSGYWKVVHHGDIIAALGVETTPRLAVYFRRLVNQLKPKEPEDFATYGAPVILHVPAAELMRLPIGVVIKDCRLAFDPNNPLPMEHVDHDLALDFSENKIKVVKRHDRPPNGGDYIIPVLEDRSPTFDSVGANAHYVAVQYKDDPYGVIIPCAEIFRFFYCTSSRMAYTILSSRILDPDRYLINPDKSGVREDDPRVVAIWLRQWMLSSDRHHLARLFFSPGKFEEAKNIFRRAIGVSSSEEQFRHALIAKPPAHGPMRLKCIYSRFSSGENERIFVRRIVSTDWSLPFKEIHFGRDNDSEQVTTLEEREDLRQHGRKPRPSVMASGTKINLLGDQPADDSINHIELTDTDFEARFPCLHKIHSPKIPKVEQSTQSNDDRHRITLASGTVVEGSRSAQEQLVSTILKSMEESDQLRDDAERSGERKVPEVPPIAPFSESNLQVMIHDLDEAVRYCEETLKTVLKVSYLPVLESHGLFNEKTINALPKTVDGKSYAWFFRDKDKEHTRPLIIAELRYDNKVRYLFEFMETDEGQYNTSTLLLWDEHSDGLIPRSVLEYTVTTCMRNTSISLRNGSLLSKFSAARLKHMPTKENEARHIRLFKKIFEAKNDMKKLRGEKPD